MAVQLGAKGQADFTQPIELLMDCHRRIEHFLSVLETVVARHGQDELAPEGRRALEVSLEYFRTAAPRHAADEEESLFPRLRALDRPDVQPLVEGAERLEREHQHAHELHARVEQIGREWIKRSKLLPHERQSISADLRELRDLYTTHIAFEDQQLFPAAAQALDTRDKREIGAEMAKRRGLAAPRIETRS